MGTVARGNAAQLLAVGEVTRVKILPKITEEGFIVPYNFFGEQNVAIGNNKRVAIRAHHTPSLFIAERQQIRKRKTDTKGMWLYGTHHLRTEPPV